MHWLRGIKDGGLRYLKRIDMINANELRIGNWVNATGVGFYCIEEIKAKAYTGNLNPIPLTPEILERVGEKSNGQYGGWLIDIGNDEKIRIVFDNIIGFNWPMFGNNMAVVSNVHQLQNLYFALTGTELNIQL